MHSARNPFTPDVFGLPTEPLALLDLGLTAALTTMGVGHILLTPVYYRHESGLNQTWFAGTGLGLAFLGMLNLARTRGDATARGLSKVANPAGLLFLAVLAARLRAPQTFVALAITLGLTALALREEEPASPQA